MSIETLIEDLDRRVIEEPYASYYPESKLRLMEAAANLLRKVGPYYGSSINITIVPPDDNPLHIREWTTANLERELEVLRWRKADAESTWGPDSENATVTRYLVEEEEQALVAELERRARAATMPSAPRWPERQEDRRDLFDEIKRRANLREVADQVLRLGIERGETVWYPCYDHDDHTPSLAVWPDGHYHCFSCQAHGDVIDLVKGALQLSSFQQALHYLGEWTGMSKRTIVVKRGDEEVQVGL